MFSWNLSCPFFFLPVVPNPFILFLSRLLKQKTMAGFSSVEEGDLTTPLVLFPRRASVVRDVSPPELAQTMAAIQAPPTAMVDSSALLHFSRLPTSIVSLANWNPFAFASSRSRLCALQNTTTQPRQDLTQPAFCSFPLPSRIHLWLICHKLVFFPDRKERMRRVCRVKLPFFSEKY